LQGFFESAFAVLSQENESKEELLHEVVWVITQELDDLLV